MPTTKKPQPWKDENPRLTKAEWVKREVAKAVNAGKAWDLETVDFSDPNRPLTCLEVDFPIIPINETASTEASSGAATKPVYQMSKWWARRQASVFRSMLLAAAIKAPDDPAEAAKLVWDVYYGNHQQKGTFKHLKVADIFMGGGTTVVEGSRLGMQMYGNDLNPVAWFVVKNELAQVDKAEVEKLLADIEAEVKPQIMPFYACDCPRGHKGKWYKIGTGSEVDQLMGEDFDPLTLTPEERKDYRYEGPEVIYTFWAKHGPCQVTGCGHRTPIMSSPVIAVKTISIKAWKRTCKHCSGKYDLEDREARMAPGVELVVADSEKSYAIANLNMAGNPESATCPHCGKEERFGSLAKPINKQIELSLLVHPDWLKGESAEDADGQVYGGRVDDLPDATARWYQTRAKNSLLVEVRGSAPAAVVLSDGTAINIGTAGGNVDGKSRFTCQAGTCGRDQNVLDAVRSSGLTAPFAAYAHQVFCPACKDARDPTGGRYFVPAAAARDIIAADAEWARLRDTSLAGYWPRNELSHGWKTHGWAVPDHGYTHYYKMFFSRQILTHSLLLRAIMGRHSVSSEARDLVLGTLAQFLRYSSGFTIWHTRNNQISSFLSNNNFQMKNSVVETTAFAPVGDGSFKSASSKILEAIEYMDDPWDLVRKECLVRLGRPDIAGLISGRTTKAYPKDSPRGRVALSCGSSTDLSKIGDGTIDLVITDPPFGEIMQYAELSDFFYVWLNIVLGKDYPKCFDGDYSPKALEAVSNPFRQDDPENFYCSVLSACWKESARVLKPGGLLAFTFHHDKDGPWVSVLQSLFESGLCLVGTFPIRGDASKGDAKVSFGAEKVEYDIIHVCRQRTEDPKPISWAKLRRQVLQDVRDLQVLLEHHQEEGLPEADLQVIRRGKALEHFSRHYGKVYKDQDTPMSVLEALLGVNQLLDEEAGGIKEPPPHNAEPFTRMLLRLFDGKDELARDQMQKFLRGTGSAPSDFESRGWVTEKKKVFYLVPPLEIAQGWVGKQRRGMTSDYDQAMFFVGACFENSGINASETLNNANFRPHPALGAILTWFKTHGADSPTRNAAVTASQLYRSWAAKHQQKERELLLFDELGEDD